MKLLHLVIIMSFLACSCSRTANTILSYQPNDTSEESTDGLTYQTCHKEDYSLKLSFVEDAGLYLAFHAEANNISTDGLNIWANDFKWSYPIDDSYNWHETINKKDIINDLKNEKVENKKRKKNRTVLNSVLSVLDVISFAATGQGGNAVLVAVESGAYIAEERRAFKAADLSLEDEIQFLEEWVLDEMNIAPNNINSFDILLPRNPNLETIVIKANLNDESCFFEYNLPVD